MGDIIEDIVKDVEVKPSKSKIVLKWVIRISAFLISAAFVFGQLKMSHLNKLDDMQKSLNDQTKAVNDLKQEMNDGFSSVNSRIDKVYSDGYKAFDDYQQYNKKQLDIIIDYGQTNKELVKKMLEVNMIEKNKNIENQLEQAKTEPIKPDYDIVVEPLNEVKSTKEFQSCVQSVATGTNDTIYYVQGATKAYINKINRNKYSVSDITDSKKYPGLYDFRYYNKN